MGKSKSIEEAPRFTKRQFKSKNSEILKQVEMTGKPVVITDHGAPVIEIHPYQPPERDPIEKLRGTITRFDNPPGRSQ